MKKAKITLTVIVLVALFAGLLASKNRDALLISHFYVCNSGSRLCTITTVNGTPTLLWNIRVTETVYNATLNSGAYNQACILSCPSSDFVYVMP